MRICLDVSPLIQPVLTGVQIVTRDLVAQLTQDYPTDDWLLFCFTPRGDLQRLEKFWTFTSNSVEKKFVPLPARLFHWGIPFIQKVGVFPIERIVGQIDHYHSFEWFHFASKAKSSATMHDWSPVNHPEWYSKENVDVFNNRWNSIKRQSHTIVTVSNFLKKEISLAESELASKIITIPNGIPADCVKPPASITSEVLKKFNLSPGFFLAVGTIGKRKNYETLIQAYLKYRASAIKPKHLVLVASLQTNLNIPIEHDGIIRLSTTNRNELMSLYVSAAAFFFPSWYEGFGLPLLEALSLGCLIIASDIPIVREIGGNKVTYVNPSKVNDWVEEMRNIVNDKQSTIYSPDMYNLKKIAAQYHNLFTRET